MMRLPFDSFTDTSAGETLGTAMSAISFASKAMLCSGAAPRYGLVTSLTPLDRG